MRVSIHGIGMLLVLLASPTVEAVELRYEWKKNDIHRYHYEEISHFRRATGGPPLDQLVTIRSTFSERVRSVRVDGAAEIELTLEQLEVYLGKRAVASLDAIPSSERTLHVSVDRRGHLTMRRMITVCLHDGSVYLGARSLDPAALRLGTLQVSGPAAGGSPTVVTVKMGEKDGWLDAVPYRLLQMLALPVGDQAVGRAVEVRDPAGTLRWSLAALDEAVATLRVTSVAAKAALAARARPAGSPVVPTMRRESDLTTRFDTKTGRLLEARGTVIQRLATKTSSTIVLQHL
jgi:hypothetical protein